MTSLKTLTLAALAAATLAATAAPSQALIRFPGHGPVLGFGNHFGHGITCLACNLPRPSRPFPVWGHGPRWPVFGHGNWGHWYRWHPVVYGGVPVAPVEVAPAAVAAIPGPAVAPQAPTGTCNCLTKQQLPNGAVLFQDVCTQQSAIAPPQEVGAR